MQNYAKLCKNYAKLCKNYAKLCKIIKNYAKLCKIIKNYALFPTGIWGISCRSLHKPEILPEFVFGHPNGILAKISDRDVFNDDIFHDAFRPRQNFKSPPSRDFRHFQSRLNLNLLLGYDASEFCIPIIDWDCSNHKFLPACANDRRFQLLPAKTEEFHSFLLVFTS
jgi:hypothetical protein